MGKISFRKVVMMNAIYYFKATKAPNFATVCYYDKSKEAFRSFRIENLVVVL